MKAVCLLHHTAAGNHRKDEQPIVAFRHTLSHRVDDPLKGLEGSDGADPLFLKARLSLQRSVFTAHQRSTCRVLQRSGVKPCYVL